MKLNYILVLFIFF